MTTKPNPVPILTPLPPDGAVLRRRAVAVRHVDAYVKQIIGQMKATLRERDDGVGLAAPQIGIPLRIVVYRENPRAAIKTLVNPEFLPVRVRHESKVAEETADEQCLSLPGRLLKIPRKTFVWVQGRNEDGRLEQYPASGVDVHHFGDVWSLWLANARSSEVAGRRDGVRGSRCRGGPAVVGCRHRVPGVRGRQARGGRVVDDRELERW